MADGGDNNNAAESQKRKNNNAVPEGGGGGKNVAKNATAEPPEPQAVREQLPGVQYCVNSPPPWR